MDILSTETVKEQLKKKNIKPSDLKNQIKRFQKGYSYTKISRPCIIGDGIKKFDEEEISIYAKEFEDSLYVIDVTKFVPASGAATRMFKDIIDIQDSLNIHNYNELSTKSREIVDNFITNIFKFPFINKVGSNINNLIKSNNFSEILSLILDQNGLNYKKLPKGLIEFHNYRGQSRTPFEEHLIEGISYAKSKGMASIHFTVQDEFRNLIEKKIDDFISLSDLKNINFNISYSAQDSATDTVAVDLHNSLITDNDGRLVFRPAGHGALINNLNMIQSDYIFIKNIDNVIKEDLLEPTIRYKKGIGRYLIFLQKKVFHYLNLLSAYGIDNVAIQEIMEFCESELFIKIDSEINRTNNENKRKYLYNKLNRPIRVCGVVKNQTEVGGGPFWVKDENSNESVQIVESAQVDFSSVEQNRIWNQSTHFNPVDLVCAVRDFKGNKFNLLEFVDYEAGIITKKSYNGKEIKALELPGLWNGSMANWITVFVEVPLITFNPVKTVFDLLKEEHQVN